MRPNVLVISTLFPNAAQPGYGVFVLNRLRAVGEHCNLRVIAPVQWYPFVGFLRRKLRKGKIPGRERIHDFEVLHPRFASIPRYLKWFDAVSMSWSVRGIVRRLRREGFTFDLVDAHWTYPDIVAAFHVARRSGAKFGVTVRGHEALYQNEQTLRRRLVTHYLRKADYVVALSSELRDTVIALGVAPAKVRIILNGVDRSLFRRLEQAACRAQLGLPANKTIIVSVGRLARGKGHQELIRSLPELGNHSDVELYIIGGLNAEDDFASVLRQMIAERGLSNVHLLDAQDQAQLPLWYNAADLFALASAREGSPNVVLEALACGTPVVVTEVGSVTEVVVPGENGYVVPIDDLASLPRVLQSALSQRWDREAIAAGMDRWRWERCAEQVRQAYESALESTSG